MSMHCALDAALNWHHHCKDNLEKLGFQQGKASPCIFNCPDKGLKLFVHGDGYVISGRESQLKWFGERMEEQYECNVNILGPKPNQDKQVMILNSMFAFDADRGEK